MHSALLNLASVGQLSSCWCEDVVRIDVMECRYRENNSGGLPKLIPRSINKYSDANVQHPRLNPTMVSRT